MINVPAEQRCNKLLRVLNQSSHAGMTDKEMAKELSWEVSSVRSTATQLHNKGLVYIAKSKNDEWTLFSDGDPVEDDLEEVYYAEQQDDAVYALANRIAEAIADYVKTVKSNRV